VPSFQVLQASAHRLARPLPAGTPRDYLAGSSLTTPLAEADSSPVEFVIGGLPSDDYQVFVQVASINELEALRPARMLERRVTVMAGQTTEVAFDVDEPSVGFEVRGSLKFPDHVDSALAIVGLEATGDDGRRPSQPAWATSMTGGKYVLADVPPGSYTVFADALCDFRSIAFGETRIQVKAADSIVPLLDLSRPEVRLQVSKEPVLRIMVTAPSGRRRSVGTDDSGLARIFGMTPGRYTAQADDHAPVEFEIERGATLILVEVP